MATRVRSIFDQPNAEVVEAQFQRVVGALSTKLPGAADRRATAHEDLLAFRHFGEASSGARSSSMNPQGAAQQGDSQTRQTSSPIFEDRAAIICLISSVLIGETEQWTEQRKYMRSEALAYMQRVKASETDAVEANGAELALPATMTAWDQGRITRRSIHDFSGRDSSLRRPPGRKRPWWHPR